MFTMEGYRCLNKMFNDDKFKFMLFWTPKLYNVMKCVVYVIMTRKQHLIFDYENFWTNTYAYMQE